MKYRDKVMGQGNRRLWDISRNVCYVLDGGAGLLECAGLSIDVKIKKLCFLYRGELCR
jgi:hypothetical protein